MSDLYMQKSAKPMLIAREEPVFDSPEFIYELKFDGERCIAYLDPNDGTQLRNKRNEKAAKGSRIERYSQTGQAQVHFRRRTGSAQRGKTGFFRNSAAKPYEQSP